MPALHDMICSSCHFEFRDIPVDKAGTRSMCNCVGGRLEILWRTSHQRDAAVHSKERTALYYSAKEGKWQYPGSNDQPVPDRLKRRGYERVEFNSLRDIERHEKQAGVRSEKAWFDAGTGRGFDE